MHIYMYTYLYVHKYGRNYKRFTMSDQTNLCRLLMQSASIAINCKNILPSKSKTASLFLSVSIDH